jgi:hypothetical protein
MAWVQGFVISEAAVESTREDGDTADVKLTIGREQGSELLEQRVIRFALGRSKEHLLEGRQEVVYVRLDSDLGGSCIHLPPRIPHTLENHGPGKCVYWVSSTRRAIRPGGRTRKPIEPVVV